MRIFAMIIMALMMMANAEYALGATKKKTRKRPRPVRRIRKPAINPNILVIDTGCNTRAMEIYMGSQDVVIEYGRMVNTYKRAMGDSINVYCMVIPTAVGIYCPDSLKYKTKDETATLQQLYDVLDNDVTPIKLMPVLTQKADQPIYSRTDHHWAPLGAYYAAEQFAADAHVPFLSLDRYESRVVKDYVGTMYKFSRNIAVKQAPEDFVYYVPKDIEYNTEYKIYYFDRHKRVTGESELTPGEFFRRYEDGNGAAYCTFMGGDTRFTKVTTKTANGRKLMILKDSYGNALPGYLFASFSEIHVVDYRYFQKNIVDYAHNNGITDVLFANNLIHASMNNTYETYLKLINI